MIIVKMNNTTVECNIAASELREIGLTPESVVNGEMRSVPFMAQLNKEVGEQLDYNPENDTFMQRFDENGNFVNLPIIEEEPIFSYYSSNIPVAYEITSNEKNESKLES